jgi:hypothetical protein
MAPLLQVIIREELLRSEKHHDQIITKDFTLNSTSQNNGVYDEERTSSFGSINSDDAVVIVNPSEYTVREEPDDIPDAANYNLSGGDMMNRNN